MDRAIAEVDRMKPVLLNHVKSAWRQRRVQTDPTMSVLLDALMQGDVAAADEVARSSDGRVHLEPVEARWTAVAVSYATVTIDYGGGSMTLDRPGAPISFHDVDVEEVRDGGRPIETVFSIRAARAERAGVISHFDIYDERGEFFHQHVSTKYTGWEVTPGDELGIAQVRLSRREVIRAGIEQVFRRCYHAYPVNTHNVTKTP